MDAAGSAKKRKITDENRKFNETWTEKFFFIEERGKLVCLICKSVVAVPKEFNVKRHYETKHSNFEQFKGELRKQKILSLQRSLTVQQTMFTKISKESEMAMEVSYEISELIAKSSRPFTDGDFVKKCLIVSSQKLCPESVKTFESISLSRMTVQRRIADMAADVSGQTEEKAKKFIFFSLAADESTDISSTAQLLVFIRGITTDFHIFEGLLGMISFQGQTKGSDLLSGILELCAKMDLDLSKLVGIVTDGAPAMIGSKSGMVSLLRQHLGEHKHHLIQFHCIIHQQSLCGKELGFENVMKVVVSVVNFIKSRGLNHRQFKSFLEEIDAEYQDLVFYTEVRWMSRGKTLQRFFELLEEIKLFLVRKDKIVEELQDDKWLCDLAFLVDITQHLNALNAKLQGKNQFVSNLCNYIFAFQSKLKLFQSHLENGNLVHFPACRQKCVSGANMSEYVAKLAHLQSIFEHRFTDFKNEKKGFEMFADPFSVIPDEAPPEFQLELIDLQSCDSLRNKFKEGDLLTFYKCVPGDEYPKLCERAAIYACLFGSTYSCEQAFSIMNISKSKFRSRLTNENLQSILQLATTELRPNIQKLVKNMQPQKSH